jgi:c(7)-type cytochrome triheme protein
MKLRFTLIALLIGLLTPLVSSAAETKDIQFKFKNADPVVFSHAFHLIKYNNNCKVCHNAIFDIRKRRHFTMAEMEKTKACGACHTGVKAFSVTSEKDCIRCHAGKPRTITYRLKGVSEAVFSHEKHIAKIGGKCRSCHNGKVIIPNSKPVTMAEMEKGKTCGACHTGKGAFSVAGNCGNCHKGMQPKDVVFKTAGITAAAFSHKIHLDMDYKCAKCHTAVFPYKAVSGKFTMGDMEKGKSCGICHNGKDAFSSSGDCEKCHKAFKPGVVTFKTDGGNVNFSHEFHLGMYKCADCHTKVFPFKAGVQHIGMGGMEQGKSCGTCHNGKDAFSTKGDCEKCHKM